MGSGTDFVFDHCSFSWSTDEVINPYGPTTMTFQSSIFSEALFNSTYAYTTDPNNGSYPNPHSMGPLIGNGTNRVTFYNCLFAHDNQRNPLVGGSIGGGSEFELVNNLVYDYGYSGTQFGFDGTPVSVNFINSFHLEGPETATARYGITIIDGVTAYARGNINNTIRISMATVNGYWGILGYTGHDGPTRDNPVGNTISGNTFHDSGIHMAHNMRTLLSNNTINEGLILGYMLGCTRLEDNRINRTSGEHYKLRNVAGVARGNILNRGEGAPPEDDVEVHFPMADDAPYRNSSPVFW